jgi:hypothetical protein
MIFSVKPDLRRKSRYVARGHKVDSSQHSSSSSVVRMDSICLLNVIAKQKNLQVSTGDFGDAYVNAEMKEEVYVVYGPEFGPELADRIAIIKKSILWLKIEWESLVLPFRKVIIFDGIQAN